MEYLVIIAGAIVIGIRWHRFHAKRDAALAKCESEGHDYAAMQNAMDNPHWPVRICRTCGHNAHYTRCVCGKKVNRDTNEVCDE